MIAFLTTDAAGYMTGGLRGRRLDGPLGQNRVERRSAQLRVDRARRDLDLRARRRDPRVASDPVGRGRRDTEMEHTQ